MVAARSYTASPKEDDSKAASVPAAGGSTAHGDDAAELTEWERLRPLYEVLLGEASSDLKVTLPELSCKATCINGKTTIVRTMTATIPDPVGASISFRFDEVIDAIERSALGRHYVLERWRFPWSERGKSGEGKSTLGIDPKTWRPVVTHTPAGKERTPPHAVPGEPGMLVFREVRKPDRPEKPARPDANLSKEPTNLLAVFLVPETPTYGIDRRALNRELTLAESVEDAFPANAPGSPTRGVHMLAPWYSGSMPTLRDGLLEWIHECESRKDRRYDILSGSAVAFDRVRFLRAFDTSISVQFHSTVHHADTVQQAVLTYLGYKSDPKPWPFVLEKRVAILKEQNTGTGATLNVDYAPPSLTAGAPTTPRGVPPKNPISRLFVQLNYPLHISEVRRNYESQGLLRDANAQAFRSSAELREKSGGVGEARDVLPDMTPGTTAVTEDRVLTQSLRFLEDNKFHIIGIISTDPHDSVFLSRLVSKYCPDAQIFVIFSDLLLLDPETIADLRGTFVGSTYPLYPLNHEWTGANPATRGLVFASQYAQGGFNASTILLNRMLGRDESDGLVEYSVPKALKAGPLDGPAPRPAAGLDQRRGRAGPLSGRLRRAHERGRFGGPSRCRLLVPRRPLAGDRGDSEGEGGPEGGRRGDAVPELIEDQPLGGMDGDGRPGVGDDLLLPVREIARGREARPRVRRALARPAGSEPLPGRRLRGGRRLLVPRRTPGRLACPSRFTLDPLAVARTCPGDDAPLVHRFEEGGG